MLNNYIIKNVYNFFDQILDYDENRCPSNSIIYYKKRYFTYLLFSKKEIFFSLCLVSLFSDIFKIYEQAYQFGKKNYRYSLEINILSHEPKFEIYSKYKKNDTSVMKINNLIFPYERIH